MSLDVFLSIPGAAIKRGGSGIFIRENGQTKEISRQEWDARNPGVDPVSFADDSTTDVVYTANVTGNLYEMACAAGIADCLWHPSESWISEARQLISPLCHGLSMLLDNPGKFHAYNPSNGWGSYEVFVGFVSEYLAACIQFPDAEVSVCR